MATYCAKHFTYIISHRIEAKSYFILHPESPQTEKKSWPDPTHTSGPQPPLRSCAHMIPRAS